MNKTTHTLAGLATAVIITSEPFPIALTVVGSLFPDIDIKGSYANRKTGIIGWINSKCFEHRGFTHSLTLVGIIVAVSIYFNFFDHAKYFVIGMLTHIFLDLFNNKGVKLFSPFPFKVCFHWTNANGWIPKLLDVMFLCVIVLTITPNDISSNIVNSFASFFVTIKNYIC